MWSAIIPAAASLVGGLMGRKSAEKQQEENIEYQKEFAQHGIQWRVADAKAAGIHPVYALQGGGASFSPSPIIIDPLAEAISKMGQHAGQFFRQATQAPGANRVPDADLGAISVNYPGDGVGPVDWSPTLDKFKIKPSEVFSSSSTPGIAAGPAGPGMNLFTLPGGMPILLPGPNISEGLEPLSESAVLAGIIFKLNMEHFGEKWGEEFIRRYIPFGEDYYNVRGFLNEENALGKAVQSVADRIPKAPATQYPMPPAQLPDEYERLQGRGMTREGWKADQYRRRNAVGPSRWRRN